MVLVSWLAYERARALRAESIACRGRLARREFAFTRKRLMGEPDAANLRMGDHRRRARRPGAPPRRLRPRLRARLTAWSDPRSHRQMPKSCYEKLREAAGLVATGGALLVANVDARAGVRSMPGRRCRCGTRGACRAGALLLGVGVRRGGYGPPGTRHGPDPSQAPPPRRNRIFRALDAGGRGADLSRRTDSRCVHAPRRAGAGRRRLPRALRFNRRPGAMLPGPKPGRDHPRTLTAQAPAAAPPGPARRSQRP